MKEGNESWLHGEDQGMKILVVNYTGYQNSRLVLISFHKWQPADRAAFADNVVAPQVICSKPQLQVSMPQHQEAISRVNCSISLGSELMP